MSVKYWRDILPNESIKDYFETFIRSQGGDNKVNVTVEPRVGDVLEMTVTGSGITARVEIK